MIDIDVGWGGTVSFSTANILGIPIGGYVMGGHALTNNVDMGVGYVCGMVGALA